MNNSHRKLVAVVGVAASLALPIAAYAQATQSSSPATTTARVGNHPRIDFAAIATELKLPVEQVRTAFHDNRPAKTGTRPTQAQRDAALAATAAQLGVSAAELKSLVSEYGGGAAAPGGATAGQRPRIDFASIATELKLPVEQVRTAFHDNRPAKTGTRPTQAQRDAALAATATQLGVSAAELKSLVAEYGGGAGTPAPTMAS